MAASHKKYLNKQIELHERRRIREGREGAFIEDSDSDLENGDILDSDEEERLEVENSGIINPSQVFKAGHATNREKEFQIFFNNPVPEGVAVVGGDVKVEEPKAPENDKFNMFEDEDPNAKIGDGEDSPEEEEDELLNQKFKPVEGVKFVEYDEFGLPK